MKTSQSSGDFLDSNQRSLQYAFSPLHCTSRYLWKSVFLEVFCVVLACIALTAQYEASQQEKHVHCPLIGTNKSSKSCEPKPATRQEWEAGCLQDIDSWKEKRLTLDLPGDGAR